MQKIIDKTMMTFLLVGVFNTLVGCGTMFLLYNLAACSYWFSSATNYIVGGIVSFFLNKYFTFQNYTRSLTQAVKFIINTAACYVIAYGAAKPVMTYMLSAQTVKVQENVAMFVGMVVYTAFNYVGQRFFVFFRGGKQH